MTLDTYGLPKVISGPASDGGLILNWKPCGQGHNGTTFQCFAAGLPRLSVVGLRDFIDLAQARKLAPTDSIRLRAIGSKRGGYQFTLSGDVVLHGAGVTLTYTLRPTSHHRPESVLIGLPALSPCRADDTNEPATTMAESRNRANELAAEWPEARLGLVTVRHQKSPFVTVRNYFRGRDMIFLQACSERALVRNPYL